MAASALFAAVAAATSHAAHRMPRAGQTPASLTRLHRVSRRRDSSPGTRRHGWPADISPITAGVMRDGGRHRGSFRTDLKTPDRRQTSRSWSLLRGADRRAALATKKELDPPRIPEGHWPSRRAHCDMCNKPDFAGQGEESAPDGRAADRNILKRLIRLFFSPATGCGAGRGGMGANASRLSVSFTKWEID